jgi:hypothetical protein
MSVKATALPRSTNGPQQELQCNGIPNRSRGSDNVHNSASGMFSGFDESVTSLRRVSSDTIEVHATVRASTEIQKQLHTINKRRKNGSEEKINEKGGLCKYV